MNEEQVDIAQQLWRPIRRRRWMVLFVTLAAVALVLVWQAVRTPQYTARVVVAPTDQGVSNINSQLSRLSGLASIAGVSIGDKGTVTEFEKFQFLLFSDRLGMHQAANRDLLEVVFAKLWDARNQRWMKPDTIVQSVKDMFWPVFGLPAWLPPDGRDLAKEYDRRLSTRKLGESQLLQITYEDEDPQRAETVLRAIVHDSNDMLRRDAQLKAKAQAAYLRQQLALAQVQEYRENLASLLARQEQTLVLTSTDLPFAADLLQPDTLSKEPTSQRPVLFAGIAAVIGFCAAVFIAIVLGVPERRGQRERDQ